MPRIELDRAEALRYAGVTGAPPPDMSALAEELAARLEKEAPPRWVLRVFGLSRGPEGVTLEGSGVTLTGNTAGAMLADCGQAALIACTLGGRSEALFRAEQARGMDRALLLDGCGSALVEAGCDAAEHELAARFPGLYLTDRFSPGYGDLPLSVQPALCAALDTFRRLGVQVTDSFLLNPAKSVTAVVGLSPRPQPARVRGCKYCTLRDTCTYKKGGRTCAS